MKKFFIYLFIGLFAVSTVFMGIGCKTETTGATEAKSTEAELTEAEAEATEAEATEAETTEAVGKTIKEPASMVELTWWAQASPANLDPWFNEFISVFEEKHPNIKVKLVSFPYEELNTKLFTSISQGNEGDILNLYDDWLFNKDVSQIFGSITPDLYTTDELKGKQWEAALKNVTGSDGEIYGVSMGTGANAAGILLHEDLFEEVGIDPLSLKTWDDVKKAAKKLTVYNDDGTIKRSGIAFTYSEAAVLFLDLIADQGALDKLVNSETNEWNFNIPEAKNAMELIYSFVEEKLFDPASGDPFIAFPDKFTAMLVIGPWGLGMWTETYPDLKMNYITMPPFPMTDTAMHTLCSWYQFCISKRLEGEKKNAALIFIKEIVENPALFDIPYTQNLWAGITGSRDYLAYLTKSLDEGKPISSQTEIVYRVAQQFGPNITPPESVLTYPALILETIYPEMQSVFLGTETIDEMLNNLTSTLTQKEKEAVEALGK